MQFCVLGDDAGDVGRTEDNPPSTEENISKVSAPSKHLCLASNLSYLRWTLRVELEVNYSGPVDPP
jgi:hypothetical protein